MKGDVDWEAVGEWVGIFMRLAAIFGAVIIIGHFIVKYW